MPKDAPGRNDSCPCGSGKKFKKCCSGKDSDTRASASRAAWDRLPFEERARIAKKVQRLDDLSNGVLDAIEAKRYDEAERLCEELLREYPEVIDGHDRFGMLRQAQGRFQEAAEEYEKALAMIDEHPRDYDPEAAVEFRQRRDEVLALIKPT
jgi:uncharacterized protein YecA (UPF0149 family)